MRRSWIVAGAASIVLLGTAAILQRAPSAPAQHDSGAITVAKVAERTNRPPPAAAASAPRSSAAPSPAGPSIAAPTGVGFADQPPPLPDGLEGSFDPLAFARSVRAEKRDGSWAPAAEASLRSSIARISYMGPQMKTVSAYCGSTRCEVTGTMPVGLPKESMNVAMQEMQGERMTEMLGAAHQQQHGVMFGEDTFTIWTIREPVQAPR